MTTEEKEQFVRLIKKRDDWWRYQLYSMTYHNYIGEENPDYGNGQDFVEEITAIYDNSLTINLSELTEEDLL